jgi:hypothetical protein
MPQDNNFQHTYYNDDTETSESIASTVDLAAAIQRLEQKRAVLEEDLKEHFQDILEDLKPTNILKNTLHEVRESVPLKNNLLKVALGLGAGYFSRKLLVGKSAGLVKKTLGAALQFGITKLVAGKNEEDDGEYHPSYKKKGFFKRIFSAD